MLLRLPCLRDSASDFSNSVSATSKSPSLPCRTASEPRTLARRSVVPERFRQDERLLVTPASRRAIALIVQDRAQQDQRRGDPGLVSNLARDREALLDVGLRLAMARHGGSQDCPPRKAPGNDRRSALARPGARALRPSAGNPAARCRAASNTVVRRTRVAIPARHAPRPRHTMCAPPADSPAHCPSARATSLARDRAVLRPPPRPVQDRNAGAACARRPPHATRAAGRAHTRAPSPAVDSDDPGHRAPRATCRPAESAGPALPIRRTSSPAPTDSAPSSEKPPANTERRRNSARSCGVSRL